MGSAGPAPPQSLTNAQKLALPSNTAVGTQVAVSDGFVVSGAQVAIEAQTNGFYAPNGTTQNGHPVYQNDNGRIFYFVEGRGWVIDIASNLGYIDVASQTTSAGSGPWESNWTNQSGLTLTHPAVQQLAAPSSAQGGVFVSGGTQDGIYPSGNSINSKLAWGILGDGNGTGSNADKRFVWSTDLNGDFGLTPTSAGWAVVDDTNAGINYYSLSDVATPDLVVATPPVFVIDFNNLTVTGTPGNYGLCGASVGDAVPILLLDTNQVLASSVIGANTTLDFSAATGFIGIGVSDSPTKQQIIDKLVALGADALVTTVIVSGAGTSAVNGTYTRGSAVNGRPSYVKPGYTISWANESKWNIIQNAGNTTIYDDVLPAELAFPFYVANWDIGAGIAPVPTVTKGTSSGVNAITDLGGLKIRVSPTDSVLYPLDFSDMIGSSTTTQAGGWYNASGDSPASITVTSVTQGELDAGLTITNDGATNGSSHVTQPFHGRQYYMGLNGGGSNNMHWDTTYNVWTDDVGEWTADNVAFPWQGADADSSHSGATFSRNDVAAEANWENV